MRMTDLYSKRDAGTVYQLETKTLHPTMSPTPMPSGQPTSRPSIPRALESSAPTDQPSSSPSIRPSELNRNSSQPSSQPSARPSSHPYLHPTSQPTMTISNLVPLSPGAQGSGMMKSAPRLKGGAIAGIVIMVLLVIGFASVSESYQTIAMIMK